jgi:hypothetical protein
MYGCRDGASGWMAGLCRRNSWADPTYSSSWFLVLGVSRKRAKRARSLPRDRGFRAYSCACLLPLQFDCVGSPHVAFNYVRLHCMGFGGQCADPRSVTRVPSCRHCYSPAQAARPCVRVVWTLAPRGSSLFCGVRIDWRDLRRHSRCPTDLRGTCEDERCGSSRLLVCGRALGTLRD